MENEFFSKPILNSPYEHPSRHWELDNKGQPTHQIIQQRRRAEFITPIPKPKKRKGSGEQLQLFDFEEDDPISSAGQRYDPTPIINELRKNVDDWRKLPNPNDWLVTPETARRLQHWRYHPFNGVRPFFCQIEAVETAIWLTEDAKDKKSTMDTYWVPGVNNLKQYGRWAFAEFTEVYQIETDFEAKVEAEFNKMIEEIAKGEA